MSTGKIVQVIGPVVDMEFPVGKLPAIYNAIHIPLSTKDKPGDGGAPNDVGDVERGLATHQPTLIGHGRLGVAGDHVDALDQHAALARIDAQHFLAQPARRRYFVQRIHPSFLHQK